MASGLMQLSKKAVFVDLPLGHITYKKCISWQVAFPESYTSVYVSVHTLTQGFQGPVSGDLSVQTHILKLGFYRGIESGVSKTKITGLDLSICVYFQSRVRQSETRQRSP